MVDVTSVRFWDFDGELIDGPTWARLFEDPRVRCIATDSLGDVTVVTEWFGYDHVHDFKQPEGRGPLAPLIFGTAICRSNGVTLARSYISREAALAGHAELVDLIRGVQEAARQRHG